MEQIWVQHHLLKLVVLFQFRGSLFQHSEDNLWLKDANSYQKCVKWLNNKCNITDKSLVCASKRKSIVFASLNKSQSLIARCNTPEGLC